MGIHVTATGGVAHIGANCACEIIPERVLRDLASFLLDKGNGSVVLLVRNGTILGAKYEVSVSYVTNALLQD